MDLNILEETQNPLFKRKEIIASVKAKINPTKIEISKELSKKFSVPAEAIRVLLIEGKFGTNYFSIKANIYSTKEERDNIEVFSKKELAAEAKAAEPVKEKKEAPVEEKVEEAKEEPKEEKASE